MNYRIINFKIMGDNRGKLISLEENKNIPFNIKRVYYIFGTKKNVIRGKHSHSNLNQVVVCLSGECKFLLDSGKQKKIVKLNSPEIGLFIGENVWREMFDFSQDCILMVLANDHYNENEYIRNYKDFIKSIKK